MNSSSMMIEETTVMMPPESVRVKKSSLILGYASSAFSLLTSLPDEPLWRFVSVDDILLRGRSLWPGRLWVAAPGA